MFVVVSYDIVNDERRTKVCNKLKDYGAHTQYSVFECDLNHRQIEEMKTDLQRIIDIRNDSVKYYFLCARCVIKIQTQGKAKMFY